MSNRMQKSVLVAVDRVVKIPKYNREIRRTTKLMVRRHGVGGEVERSGALREIRALVVFHGMERDATGWHAKPPFASLQAHDGEDVCNIGDVVRIHSCRSALWISGLCALECGEFHVVS